MGLLGPNIDQLKEKKDITGLIILLKTGHGKSKSEAAWALGELQSNEAVPALIEALKNKDERCRAYAAWALGNIKDTKATKALLQALLDPKNEVRAYVSWALGNMESIGAISDLERLSKDTDPDVKKYAKESLEKIKSSKKYKEYINNIELEKKKKQEDAIQKLLEESKIAIQKLSDKKISTASLEELLLSAQEAYIENNNYQKAEELASECKKQATKRLSEHEHKTLKEKNKAYETLELARKRKQELLNQHIPNIEELFLIAENYFNSEQYPETIEALNQWNREMDEKIEQKKEEEAAAEHFKELDETLEKAEKLFIPLKEDPHITKALQNKEYLKYLEYAKKYKQEIEEFIHKSNPTITLDIPTENYKVDHWTKTEAHLKNTGSTNAEDIQITLSSDINYKITPFEKSLPPQQTTTLLFGIKPLAPGDLPVEVIIKYTDAIGREYEQNELIWLKVQEQIPYTTIQATTPLTEPATHQTLNTPEQEPTIEPPTIQTTTATKTTIEPAPETPPVEHTTEPEPPVPTIQEHAEEEIQDIPIETIQEPEVKTPVETATETYEPNKEEIPTTPTETTQEPEVKTPVETQAEPEIQHPEPEITTPGETKVAKTEDMSSVVDLLNDIGMKGMGNAASMVSQMSGQEVEADQPELKTIPKEDIKSELEPLGEQIATVGMGLSSIGDTPMNGAMYMHFSAENGFKVADLLFNNPPGTTTEYNELSISTLKETANIFGGQYLSAISEYIEIPIIPTTPEFKIASPDETTQLIQSRIGEDVDYILATELHFGAGDNKIKGELLIMFDNTTFELLLERLFA